MSLAATIQLTSQDTRAQSSSRGGEAVGQVATTSDGKVFIYTKAGAVNLVAGKLTQAPASTANHVNRTGATYTAGTSTVSFAVGATEVTADQYAGGYLVVNAGTGAGQALLIDGNTVAASSGTVTVYLREALMTATAVADSKFSLLPNLYSASVVSASGSAPAIPITGVPVINVTAGNYYWSQVGGYASVLSDGVISKNAGAIASDATAGAAEIEVAGTVTRRIGFAPEATVTTEYSPLVLTIRL